MPRVCKLAVQAVERSRRRTAGGRTRVPRMRIGAASNRAHSGFRRGLHTVCCRRNVSQESHAEVSVKGCGGAAGNGGFGGAATHARYATARLGSALKCSDSMKRESRFQDIWDSSLGTARVVEGHVWECSKGSHVERWGADRVHRTEMNNSALVDGLTMRR
jgi:hypothetical protein